MVALPSLVYTVPKLLSARTRLGTGLPNAGGTDRDFYGRGILGWENRCKLRLSVPRQVYIALTVPGVLPDCRVFYFCIGNYRLTGSGIQCPERRRNLSASAILADLERDATTDPLRHGSAARALHHAPRRATSSRVITRKFAAMTSSDSRFHFVVRLCSASISSTRASPYLATMRGR